MTDNFSPPATAAETITITVNEVNTRPMLARIGNKTVDEAMLLTFTNSATDADLPAQTLTYSLDPGSPIGASIDPATGIFTWTPTEAQGPSTNTFTTVVTDNGSPPLSATNSFTVIVNEVNSAPTLPALASQTINELATLTVINTATDTDLPVNTLTYQLLAAPTKKLLKLWKVIWPRRALFDVKVVR